MICEKCHDHLLYCSVCLTPIDRTSGCRERQWHAHRSLKYHDSSCRCTMFTCSTLSEYMDHPRWTDEELLERYKDWLSLHCPYPVKVCDMCGYIPGHSLEYCTQCPGRMRACGPTNLDTSLALAGLGIFRDPYELIDNLMSGPLGWRRVQSICKPYLFDMARR